MKFFPTLLVLLPSLAGLAWADIPKKPPLNRYTQLWTNSPFTSKPPPPEAGPENNPLDDYALIGVSPVDQGFRVTLINKKKPEDRITVLSGIAKEGFSIIGVDRKPGNPMGTSVRMKSGSTSGTVRFDEKLLTLVNAPAAAPPGVNVPGQQPQLQPGQQPQLQPGQVRQPRPRVVPPPTAAPAAGQPQNQNNQRQERRR